MTASSKVSPGATTASQTLRGRLASWFSNHRNVAISSLSGLLNSWLSSLMTWLVIGVALALPTLLYLLLANIGDVSADWEGKPRLSVYLASGITVEGGRHVTGELAARPEVESARYISQDEALEEFKRLSGFGEVLSSLDANPLPAVIEIVPVTRQPAELRLLVTRVEGMEAVASVSLDLAWIERLFAILALGERFVGALAFFLALGVLLSIGNTIRLAIENRRAEIEVVKLVGGTDSFVRRPFLYLGFWYGVGGAVVAWIMVEMSLILLAGPVDRLVRSYDDEFALIGLDAAASLILFGFGATLGILGATLAVSRHLREIEPE